MEKGKPFSRAGPIVNHNNPVRPHMHASELAPVETSQVPSSQVADDVNEGLDADNPTGGDDADEHAEPKAKVRSSPMAPTKEMRDTHEAMGHAVYRAWCGPCVKGRGRDHGHFRKDRDDEQTPVISWDYGFLSAKGHETKEELEEIARSGQSPVLCNRDRCSESPF